jgi:hypothetical protein
MGGMGEILAALFFAPLLLGLVLWGLHLYFRGFEGYTDPARLGAVVESELELDAIAPVVGSYHGDEIYEWVRYRGERYDYAFVATPRYKRRVKRGELYLAPGIVYARRAS